MPPRTGFLEYERRTAPRRAIGKRVNDYREVYLPLPVQTAREQAMRCMDCGVAFCHHGCPLGNLIPEWNDLVARDEWKDAIARLHATNNFPEFTGRLCPAPCEPACVLAINDDAVSIEQIEKSIIERAFEEGWVRAEPPAHRTGKRVAVIGSGPAGLAAAQQLNRAGHLVTVYEKADRIGGLLRYGIPDFKMEKWVLDRRLSLLEAEGIIFETGYAIGRDLTTDQLRQEFDAVIVAVGAERARDLDIPGRDLDGVHVAMDYLVQQNRRVAGDAREEFRPHAPPEITARGKRVVIIGGGDTGADCYGNATREQCTSLQQLYIYPQPPDQRPSGNPWPDWPLILRTYPVHEEGGSRDFGLMVTAFGGDGGTVQRVHAVRVEPRYENGERRFEPAGDNEIVIDADLVLLAIGFQGPAEDALLDALAVRRDGRGNVAVDTHFATDAPGVFAAGDAVRGASLIVWAIADGRIAARSCDRYLMGATRLP
ncbi:MAG: glutamate synthase subunit beta [Chloroflexi bacterium]|nr:MAG: glutamate synthase subunit beta [Chloroflexota bacterium]